LAQKRLQAGDISELEATNSQVEALRAQADAARSEQDVVLARERLKTLTGLAFRTEEIVVVRSSIPQRVEPTAEALVSEALAARPDLRAAEIAIESAGRRAGLERQQFMTIAGILDANGEGTDGFEAGPGLQLTIPIFNRNQGGIALADANLKKAMRRYVTVRDSVTLEVRTAHTQARQAQENLDAVRTRILPALEKAVALARKNYQDGGTSYFLVLETTGQFLDARARELELAADVRRAVAELERSVGRRLVTNSIPPEHDDTTHAN
jgi:cobalt-zinc-cadmium efflux system outer membrane protein